MTQWESAGRGTLHRAYPYAERRIPPHGACWQKLHENPESADRWVTKYTERNRQNLGTRG